MNIKTLLLLLVVCTIITIIIIGVTKTISESEDVRNECVKTNLVVIGNKGIVTPVYDCGKE